MERKSKEKCIIHIIRLIISGTKNYKIMNILNAFHPRFFDTQTANSTTVQNIAVNSAIQIFFQMVYILIIEIENSHHWNDEWWTRLIVNTSISEYLNEKNNMNMKRFCIYLKFYGKILLKVVGIMNVKRKLEKW